MPFGELVTSLRADLAQYRRDLNAAYAEAAAFARKVEQLQVRLTPGAAGSRGTGPGGDVDARFRAMRSANLAAEAEQRRFAAAQAAAERENDQRDLRRVQFQDQQDRNKDARFRAMNSANRAAEAEQRRMAAAQTAAEKDNVKLGVEAMKARQANLKQQILLKRELESQDKVSAKAAVQTAKDEMKAKEANIKQQINLQRYLEDQDKKDTQKQRQDQRDEIRIAKVASVRAEFERTHSVIGRMDRAIQAIDGNSLKNLLATAKQVARAFGAIGAFGVAGGVVAAVKGGIDLNREYQRQLTTMASILAMTTRVTDSQGHSVNRQKALNFQLQEAGKLYTLIRREAASTILTGRELFGAVSANLGLGASAGMSPEQTVQVTKQITQFAKASGLQGERQFAQETRALLTGQGLQSGTVARILGIFSKKQIDEHIQKGDLFQYIMDRVNKAEPFLRKFRMSFDGILTTLTTKAQDLNRLAFEKFFEKLTARMGDLNKAISEEKIEEWAEKISSSLIKVFDAINGFVASGGFQKLMNFFTYLVNHGVTLLSIFGGLRAALTIGGAAAGLRDLQRREQAVATQAALLNGGQGVAGAVGAAGANTRLGRVAGGAAGVLSVLGAGVAGYELGTAGRELIRGLSGVSGAEDAEAESAARLRDMQRGKAAQGERLRQARERVRETGRVFAAILVGDDPNKKRIAQHEMEGAIDLERKLRYGIMVEKQKTADETFHLDSLEAEKNARLRRENANKERVKAALETAKLTDDKVRQIRAQAQLEAIDAKAKITDKKHLNEVLKAIEKKMYDDIKDFRTQQLIDFKQMMAQQTGIVEQSLEAEYLATIKSIEDKKLSDDREDKLKAAALVSYQRKLRDNRDQQMVEERKFNADVKGNFVEQLNAEYLEKAAAIRKEVESHKQGRAAQIEIERKFHLLNLQYLRERRDKVQEFEDKGRDLARRAIQTERERANLIKQYTKETSDAQKQMAADLRALAKERVDATRELGKAQRQSQLDTFRLGHGERFIGFDQNGKLPAGTVSEPGQLLTTRGILQRQFGGINQVGLQDEVAALLQSTGVNEVLTQVLSRRHGEEMGPGLAQRASRELRDLFAGGDVEGGFNRLQELGVNPGNDFRQGVRKIGNRSLLLQNAEANLQDREAREELKQQKEDQGQAVKDAEQRVKDLAERQQDLLKSYAETIQNIHANFNDAISKAADELKNLREEVVKYREAARASGVTVRPDFAAVLGKTADTRGKGAGQAGAETLAHSVGGTVYNMIFGANSIQLDATSTDALRNLADAIDKVRLRTAPATR